MKVENIWKGNHRIRDWHWRANSVHWRLKTAKFFNNDHQIMEFFCFIGSLPKQAINRY